MFTYNPALLILLLVFLPRITAVETMSLVGNMDCLVVISELTSLYNLYNFCCSIEIPLGWFRTMLNKFLQIFIVPSKLISYSSSYNSVGVVFGNRRRWGENNTSSCIPEAVSSIPLSSLEADNNPDNPCLHHGALQQVQLVDARTTLCSPLCWRCHIKMLDSCQELGVQQIMELGPNCPDQPVAFQSTFESRVHCSQIETGTASPA